VTPQAELQLLEATSTRRPPHAPTIAGPILEACSAAALQLGGPTLKSLGVTSTIRGEGKTIVAMGMAVVQRKDFGRKVLLLELDFDHPALAIQHGADVWPGLSELVMGEATIEQVIHPLADGIAIVTVGAAPSAGPRTLIELLRSGVLQEIGRDYDVMVGDLPPLLGSNFGHLLAEAFQRVLLVVRAGVTPLGRIQEATASLGSEPAVLLNGVSSALPRWIRQLRGNPS
jgi:Mrp family chromosome partitioning ATPase